MHVHNELFSAAAGQLSVVNCGEMQRASDSLGGEVLTSIMEPDDATGGFLVSLWGLERHAVEAAAAHLRQTFQSWLYTWVIL